MNQPSALDNRLSAADIAAVTCAAPLPVFADRQPPAIVHPNFDPKQPPLDPARSLADIPEPARRLSTQLRRLYGNAAHFYEPNQDRLSKWALIASEVLAEHVSLLRAAQLVELPESFYHNHSERPLLSPFTEMALLDLSDIQQALQAYPKLHRYGVTPVNSAITAHSKKTLHKRDNPDELLSSLYADDWQVILQPQQFETGEGSLATDIMACSVAVHALQQCDSRKTINHSYDADQICQYVRSYLLSQTIFQPSQRHAYRQIRLFAGHIIVAAYHLGWEIHISPDGRCCFNLSSRSGLLTRYPNMEDYHINGWSS